MRVAVESLRSWSKQYDIDRGKAEGLTTDERAELLRLRRENRRLEPQNLPLATESQQRRCATCAS